jgi:hypothetical protein
MHELLHQVCTKTVTDHACFQNLNPCMLLQLVKNLTMHASHQCLQRQGEGGSYTWEHGWPRLMARRGDAGWRLTGRSVRVGHGRGRRRAATSGGMERPEEVSVMEAAPFVEDTLVLGRWLASRVVRGPDGGEV